MHLTRTKEEQDETRLGREGDPQGTVQEIEIWPFNQIAYAQTRIRPKEWDAQKYLGFWDITRSPNPG